MPFQYRITVNSAESSILDSLPSEQWHIACENVEERGYYAKLERRLITDKSILRILQDSTRYILLDDNRVICPWEILAEADFVGS